MKYAIRSLLGLSIWASCILPLLGQADALPTPVEERLITYAPDVVLFKLKPEYRSFCETDKVTLPDLKSRFEALGNWDLRSNFPSVNKIAAKGGEAGDLDLIYELRFDGEWDVPRVLQHLRSHPSIAYAEPRYIYHTFYQPNDPLADTLLGIEPQWYLTPLQARQAWDLQRGDSSIVIGITDSGISYLHPDLSANLLLNRDDPPDGIDNDQDGFVDNYRGWDFGGTSFRGVGDNDASFVYDHGVSVAGIAAATTDNGLGAASISFNCRYLPLKAGPDEVPGAITHGYESILYAAQKGAQIINCSWGGQVRSQVGEDVVNYVTQTYGAAIVAACGNTPDDLRFFPAAYPAVLSVTNVHQGDSVCCPKIASPPGQNPLGTTYNYSVDVAAPGWRIATPTGDTLYHNFSGTSAASPVTSAAVALTLAHFPTYSGFQAAQRVRVTTDDVYQLPYNFPYRDKMGTGRINVYRALTDPLKPSIRQLSLSVKNTRGGEIFASGDTLLISGNFINYLDPSTGGLTLHIELPDSQQRAHLEILAGSFQPGVIPSLGTFSNAATPFKIYVKPGAPEDLAVALRLSYRDTTLRYDDFEYLEFQVNPTLLDITENLFHTSVSSSGHLGYKDYPVNNIGLGVKFRGDERSVLFEGGFLLGSSPQALLDNLRDERGVQQQDFSPGELIRPVLSRKADFVGAGRFDDRNANRPLGVSVSQRVYAWHEPRDENYIILEYVIHNKSGSPLNGLYAGLMADWNLINPETDACSFDPLYRMVFAYDVDGINPNYFAISMPGSSPLRAAAYPVSNFTFSDSAKFRALSNVPTGTSASAGLSGGGTDIVHFISSGPFNLAAADSFRVAFALMGGNTFSHLQEIARRAEEKYRCYVREEGPVEGFAVSANPAGRNQPLQFTDLNTTAITWDWDFGDGQSSNLQNPVHSYQQAGNYTVQFTASDGDCEVKQTGLVEVRNVATTLGQADFGAISLYPNPTPGHMRLVGRDLAPGLCRWRITNALGQEIAAGAERGPFDRPIDLSRQPAGIYWLQLTHPEGRFQQKIIRE